ncbi:L-aspartate oxidase [Prosthecochloris sp. N3]|uniref:L-aspartate oxidase n=1 Tax=Prosthecochloris ethylica TaxID=2743976 RepID=A0ABR9XRL3_9CHLB|nr:MULTISPECIES: L-aspartate oxidase [Prosthecochloris]MBF0586728.1 L-aspartate oxidase [Prosthecochloris ethylica]MBF0636634.1 L-aspartate oxidase [Prosthecochloris ethylica]NUK47967.1 L-aspartate oxidase [Prosthecochloris ethylica]RNA65268.1 L-aspartate oxidase [Prosthecochloris sp. ZM_2]
MTEEIKTDILVIGSGIGGLYFALNMADHATVTIITKKESSTSNTNWAQGGIAATIDENDSPDYHVQDTLDAGAGLCNQAMVELMVNEGPRHIRQLIDYGVHFTMADNEHLDLGREGGHSHKRIVHAKDLTGQEVEHALLEKINSHPNIELLEHHFAIELLTEHHLHIKTNDINCYGAYALDTRNRQLKKILSRVTMLASGGLGHVYPHTTNPDIATGDGVAMAYRAGAMIANMEFIQFHPTSLYHPKAKSFLISEALRGFGGVLKLRNGKAFMQKYDKRENLAPRDIVARAIDSEMKKTGDECVFLDVTHLDADKTIQHFPNIYETCLEFGIDITKEMIPVVPAAHYSCGGIKTDDNGRTSINRLYACGETSCTGVHGANRLASNSLLEALVFAYRSSQDIKSILHGLHNNRPFPDWDDTGTVNPEEWILVSHNKKEAQQVMNDYVGIVRSDLRLQRAKRRIEFLKEETEAYYKKTRITSQILELRNIIKVASLIIDSAIQRRESRGLHYTTDYPQKDDKFFLKDTLLRSF